MISVMCLHFAILSGSNYRFGFTDSFDSVLSLWSGTVKGESCVRASFDSVLSLWSGTVKGESCVRDSFDSVLSLWSGTVKGESCVSFF